MVDKSMVKRHPRCAYCTDSPQLALNGRMNWFSSGSLLNLAPGRRSQESGGEYDVDFYALRVDAVG